MPRRPFWGGTTVEKFRADDNSAADNGLEIRADDNSGEDNGLRKPFPEHQSKLDEEKPTYAGVSQENRFSRAYLLSLLRLVKSAAKLCTC
jgi:hypothetical protein